MKHVTLLTAIAVLVVSLDTQPSQAAPNWKCGQQRCFWVEGYTGPVPDFAAGWGPPTCPGGYYVLSTVSKKWREVCP